MATLAAINEIREIASVFKPSGLRAGIIVAIQRKRYWRWIPFGYYFQLGFSAKNDNKPAFIGWFDGSSDGESLLKEQIEINFPGSYIVPKSKMADVDHVLNQIEDLIAKSQT